MRGICGWFSSSSGATARDDTLDAMLRAGRPAAREAHSYVTPDGRMAVGASSVRDACWFSGEGIAVAIVGQPVLNLRDKRVTVVDDPAFSRRVAEAYWEKGSKVLELLTGAFALTILDTTSPGTLIAIDRFGVESLSFHYDNDRMVFGSTLDAVRSFPGAASDIDVQSIYSYLYFHMVPSPRTIYADIHKLEPAQFIHLTGDGIEQGRYWEPRFSPQGSEKELRNSLNQALKSAVRDSVDGENTGAFLSGGLDSSTVVGLLAETDVSNTGAYSIGFAQDGYDEMVYARTTAEHFDIPLHEYYVTAEDVAASIPEIASAYDEPFGNSSAVPTLFCARLAASNGTSALLAGDGGDELFAGNTRYARQMLFDAYDRIPRWLRAGLVKPLFGHDVVSKLPLLRKVHSYITQAELPMPDRMETYNYLYRFDPTEVFTPEYIQQVDTTEPIEHLRSIYERAPTTSMLDRMLYLDWQITLADNDLRKVNEMCALAGVDVKYPMLDDRVVDVSTSVPPDLKLRPRGLRYFYRRAVADFLPQAVLEKKKHGFGLPFGEWLAESRELRDRVNGDLSSFKARSIVRSAFIDELQLRHQSEHAAYYGTMIWILMMLEEWLQSRGH